MTRYQAGGTVADVVTDTQGNVLGPGSVALFGDSALTVPIDDLLDLDGTEITTVPVDAKGRIQTFQLPDDGTAYAYAAWVWPGNGTVLAPGQLVVSSTVLSDLLVRLRAVETQIGSGGGGSADGPVNRYTFDTGSDGTVLTKNVNDVVDVKGSPTYKATSARYGTGLGVAILGASGLGGLYGRWGYESPSPTGSDYRIYFRIDTVGVVANSLVVTDTSIPGGGCGSVWIRPGLQVVIYDADKNAASSSSSAVATVGAWARLDVRSTYNAALGIQTITTRLFVTDPEGATPDSVLSASFPAAIPDLVYPGTNSSDTNWVISFDEFASKAGVNAWIPAVQPTPPDWDHTYEAVADGAAIVGDSALADATAVSNAAYDAATKIHGTRGLKTTAGKIRYPIRTLPGEAYSLYHRWDTKGASASPLLVFGTSTSTQLAMVRQRTASPNPVDIADGSGTNVAGPTIAGIAQSAPGRTNVSWTWTSAAAGTLIVNVKYAVGSGGESTTEEALTHTFTGVAQPTWVEVGYSGAGWVGTIDDHRASAVSTNVDYFGPLNPPNPQQVIYAQPHLDSSTQVTIQIQSSGIGSLNVGYSNTADGAGTPTGTITYIGAQTPDGNGLARFVKTGLTAGQLYYARPCTAADGVSFVGDPLQFQMRPAAATAFTRGFAVISCQQAPEDEPAIAGAQLELVWKEIAARAVATSGWIPRWMPFLGDGGYWGSQNLTADLPLTLAGRWWHWLTGLPNQRKTFALVPSDVQKDDHEVGPGNLDSLNSTVVSNLNNNALGMQGIFAMHPLAGADSTGPNGTYKRHMFGTFDITPRIQVIMLDAYSMDRSSGQTSDDGNQTYPTAKTFLGADQDTKLRTALTTGTYALRIILCGKAYLGANILGVPPSNHKEDDKVHAYPSWRRRFGEFVVANGLSSKIVWIGGDRHFNAYAPGSFNPYGGFPCYVSSGISMHNLKMVTGEDGLAGGATEGYTKYDTGVPKGTIDKTVMQYLQFTLADDNSHTITLSALSRYLVNAYTGVGGDLDESTHWADWAAAGLSDGFTSTDSFAY